MKKEVVTLIVDSCPLTVTEELCGSLHDILDSSGIFWMSRRCSLGVTFVPSPSSSLTLAGQSLVRFQPSWVCLHWYCDPHQLGRSVGDLWAMQKLIMSLCAGTLGRSVSPKSLSRFVRCGFAQSSWRCMHSSGLQFFISSCPGFHRPINKFSLLPIKSLVPDSDLSHSWSGSKETSRNCAGSENGDESGQVRLGKTQLKPGLWWKGFWLASHSWKSSPLFYVFPICK